MKIPLFDIDGTLFKAGDKTHADAFKHAFKTVYGIPAVQTDIYPEGMTYSQIIVEVLRLRGLTSAEIRRKIKATHEAMADYFKEHENETFPEILPGVVELLEKLRKQKIPIGLLTGNVEKIAWTKIERAGLKGFFDFGAFGNRSEIRSELVEIARVNAENFLKRPVNKNELIIIGDTPKDITCARDAGIKAIVAPTGFHSFDELAKEKPDLLVRSLEEQDKVLNFLKN